MSNFSPNEAPLIKLGHGVDVLELNARTSIMGLMVHVTCWEHELQTAPIKEKVKDSVKWAMEYLIAEGFIATVKGWHVAVSVMGHPPKE